MKRIYHHYTKWEDWQSGMYRAIPKEEEKQYLQWAIEFITDTEKFGKWMMIVIDKYKYACEHNLTDRHTNNRAWIGQCAVHMATNCPEYITRLAWGYLTKEQQTQANAKADKAIKEWHKRHENKTAR